MTLFRTRTTATVLLMLGAFQGCDCGTDDAELVDDATAATGSGMATSGLPSGGGGSSASVTVGPGAGGDATCSETFTSIAITPASSEATLDGTSPASAITFEARGVTAAGDQVPLAESALSWSVSRDDDTPPGEIDDGVLDPYPFAGGVVRVAASGCGAEGEATVTFFLDAQVGVPANPSDWEGDVVEGEPGAPAIVYPSDETRLPRNVYRTIFQWYRGATSDARVTFEGPHAIVTVYTDGGHGLCADAQPSAGCWEVDEQAWQLIAGSNAGETVTWTVDALDDRTDPPTILRGDPSTMGISKQDVKGAIFYWSTTSAGIRRGRLSEPDPIDYVAAGTDLGGGDEVRCVACHVVSRSGKYLAAPTDSRSGKGLSIYEVTDAAPPTPLVRSIDETDGHGFATISPDDERLVAAWGGEMWELAREGGGFVADIETGDLEGTHPDWSPLGDEVVFATGKGDSPGDSSLARVPYDGGVWGEAEVFLAPPEDRTNLFPMFSPTGAWIAFSQGKGGHGDPEAQLFIVPSGEPTPVELVRANRMTSNEMTDGQYQNSQPTWAPPGDYDWIAFNTKRPYGVILDEGTQQIWVAAVDVDLVGSGDDPSFPAFRVPFQGLDENNHRAYWTLDVTEGEGGGGAGGGGVGGQGGGGGDEPGCSEVLGIGDPCDPVEDCCETGSICDSYDDGVTYECHSNVPN